MSFCKSGRHIVSLFKRSLADTAIINARQRRAIQGQIQDNYLHEYLNCDANCMLTTLQSFSAWFLLYKVYINTKTTPHAYTETYIYIYIYSSAAVMEE